MTTATQYGAARRLLPSPITPTPVPSPFGAGQLTACEGADSEIFFDEERFGEAKAICATCPVQARCLVYAVDCEQFGVWGGATPEERSAMRGSRPVWTPEERLLAQELRDRIASGQPMRSVAEWSGVTERTLYRWIAEAGRSAA